jgi:hypothetical protein
MKNRLIVSSIVAFVLALVVLVSGSDVVNALMWFDAGSPTFTQFADNHCCIEASGTWSEQGDDLPMVLQVTVYNSDILAGPTAASYYAERTGFFGNTSTGDWSATSNVFLGNQDVHVRFVIIFQSGHGTDLKWWDGFAP